MSIRFNRRTAGTIAATTIAALSLVACSGEESSGGSSDGGASAVEDGTEEARGPITFAMGANDTDKLVPIIEAWNAEHPDEEVTLKELPGEADAQRETLIQSLQAGNSDYDVMALDVVWTGEFAANQYLAPLEGALEVDTSALLDATVESATYNGTLYALPQNTNGQLLFRNTEFIPEEPANFQELIDSCQELNDEVGCLTTQLSQYEGLTVNTAGFMEGWGGSILDEDDQEVTVDSEGSKAGLQALVDAYADGVITEESTAATEEETNLAFVEGRTAYAINWPYMYTNAEGEASDVAGNVEVSPLVGKDGVGVSTLGGYNNGININSENKATARDFIEFIISEDNQMSFAEASFPPVLASVYDDETLVEQFPYLPALKVSLENAAPRPVSPFYTEISKAIQDNAYAALTDGKSVDDATADMKAAIQNAAG
ncbi:ABC transporter substrate-binding protein [Corynebacterium cystitidis]|uniref:Multiple sugar transport system substrate-binding protein n=1 Tax=Corynebacterium cystitidis DSM 20524 TaxID=1121357 RepID=A0A1H9VZT7_9CORY|nr:ABC transporter substrate-binding protein [Corynebacterium cystitidis]WJY81346.1 putative ABC transporter-binding protein precursor [Corynebacterium cystitidis DSM 20524]SES27185.1 multiple sugar transport system substrate-binding protein [Corynebacterium cystitidis DSM 20524]SNV88225.1 arabinose-binding protein [Corynebacterium cystitidis]